VLVSLTPSGEKILKQLSLHHRAELRIQGPALISALKQAIRVHKDEGRGKTTSRSRRNS
jgi:hypothetical protein